MSDLALKRTILQLEKRLAFLERNTAAPGVRRRQSGTTPPWFWGRITGDKDGSDNYTFSSAKLVAGVWANETTAEGGITGTLTDYSQNEHRDLQIGDTGPVYIVNDKVTGEMIRRFVIDRSFTENDGQIFAVNLTQTGGADGTNSTAATWTYTAKSLDDSVTYGTVLTPDKQRPAVGKVTNGDGKVGLGYYDDAGDFVLYDANEVVTAAECT